MIVVVAIGIILVIGGLLVWRTAGRKDQWRREFVGDDTWELTNRSGALAMDVRIEVKGKGLAGVGVGDVGDVEPGGSVRFSTAPDAEADGRAPFVKVTWQTSTTGRRSLWAAPLTPPE